MLIPIAVSFALTLVYSLASFNNEVLEPLRIIPKLIKTIPHATPGYTQGLVWANGFLYESVGRYGQSEIRKINATTGAVHQRRSNEPNEFGEGLALKGNVLVQLTWREGYALKLDRRTLKPTNERWNYNSEGWGLSYLPEQNLFVRSDGTSVLQFHDANSFKSSGNLVVRRAGIPLPSLNELEYAKGFLYANVYGVNNDARRIVKIDPLSGTVVAEIELNELCEQEKVTYHRELNGIAYNQKEDLFYITGKNWQSIYIMRLE